MRCKINATHFTQFVGTTSDCTTYRILLSNAIRQNRLDLVEKYWKHFTPDMIQLCTSSNMFNAIWVECNKNQLSINTNNQHIPYMY